MSTHNRPHGQPHNRISETCCAAPPGWERGELRPLLDVAELASFLGVPVTTIYDWRTRKLGPPAYRLGKHLKFAFEDVQAWLAAQRDPDPPERPVAPVGEQQPRQARSGR